MAEEFARAMVQGDAGSLDPGWSCGLAHSPAESLTYGVRGGRIRATSLVPGIQAIGYVSSRASS